MTENVLLENPLELFDDFWEMPEEAFKYSKDELTAVIDGVIDSEDYLRVLVRLYKSKPEEILSREKKFEEELNKALKGQYSEDKNEVISYFMTKTLHLLKQIELFGGAFKEVPVTVTRISNVTLPAYEHEGDAGMDVRTAIDFTLEPGEKRIIPTGLKVKVPGGYVLKVVPRSGLSFKTDLEISNSPGIIDAGYRAELGIIMKNNGATSFHFNQNERIAQLLLEEIPHILWEEVTPEEFVKEPTDRGEGFGSSGTK